MTSKIRFCGGCGQELSPSIDIKYCSKCGNKVENTDSEKIESNISSKSSIEENGKRAPNYRPSTVTQLPYKSPGTAALIAFIGGLFGIPGIGHIYVGKVGKGIGILIFGLVIYAILVLYFLGFSPVGIFVAVGYLIFLYGKYLMQGSKLENSMSLSKKLEKNHGNKTQ